MAQDNSNSTMEMGTSDQVLVATKRKKTLTYVIGGAVMLAVIAVVVTLAVVLTGGDNAVADPLGPTTEGPSTPDIPTTITDGPTAAPPDTDSPIIVAPTTIGTDETDPAATTDSADTAVPTEPTTTTEAPVPEPLDMEGIIEGLFAPTSFNATWSSGSDAMFRNAFGDLVLLNVDTDVTQTLVPNTSQILQRSSRVSTLSPDGTHVVLSYDVIPGYRYSFLARYSALDTVDGNDTSILPPGVDVEQGFLQNFVWGPLGTAFAFVYLNNIYFQASLNEEPKQITTSGIVNVIYNGIPDWVYEEEVFGSNNAIWFSNDGNKIAYATFNDSDVRIMRVPQYGVPGSINYQYTQHREIRYPKSGTTNPTVTVTLYNLVSNANNVYEAPTDLDEPILKTVRFVNNDQIAVMWTNRVQTNLTVLLCTIGVSTCTQIYSYNEPDGWIDNIPLIFNEAGDSFVTILPQAVSGTSYKQVVQVTKGTDANALWTASNRINTAHTVLEIVHWSTSDVIWYKATSATDSAEQHIYSVNANSAVQCFTCNIQTLSGGQCLYNDGTISVNGTRIFINCAGPGVPEIFIYNTDGSLIQSWDTSSELIGNLENRVLPETIRLTVPIPGAQSADVQIQVPQGYQNLNNVPLLVYVYGGPDTALVTKQWYLDWGSSLVSRWNIAVAQIDGRGSGLRGVDNMFALNRKLGTVEIEDQINVTRYLQENLPWVDANRTCIWGWSYGGYAATKALAEGGSVFRCAAAVAPVVDWRFYDTIYTERYMDLPSSNPTGYQESSLLTDEVVEALRNKSYFLIHGTTDDNVHYQHAMLLSRLLQRNDVYFTQMSYTDEDHSLIGVRPHLYHGLEKFLQEHML